MPLNCCFCAALRLEMGVVSNADWVALLKSLKPRLCRVDDLRQAPFPQLVQLGETMNCWKEEIATMWRFTRNNGITESFHNKMETITRQAYGFRNFNNYRLRVKVLCG